MKSPGAGLAFVTASLIVAYASAQTISDTSRDQLIGPVHTAQVVLAEITTINGKEVETGRRTHQRVVYDRRGNEIERINYGGGSIENRTVHIIDANGRVSGWKEYEVVADGRGERLTSWSEWLYDKMGNRVEARVYRDGNLTHRTIATYNAAGLIIEETIITDGGAWKQSKKYSYDSNGRRTRTLANTNGTIELIEEAYNDAGKLISYKYSGPGGQGDSVVRYGYDAEGREVEREGEDSIAKSKVVVSYDSGGRVLRRVTQFEYKRPNISMSHAPEPGAVEFRYNENNKLVEESAYSAEGALRRRTVSEYDGGGRMRSQTYFNGDGVVVGKAIYEYDGWGNRVKTLNIGADHKGKTATHVEYRLVTYYDEK